MSHLSGWVPIRRGVIEHVIDGRLSGLEYLAFIQLVLLADAATGGGRTNAPVLAYNCGGVFNQDTSARILNKLHKEGYIWYRAKRFTTIPQPYWIHNYALTKGPMKARMTRLSQLREKQTISQDDVWRLSDERTDGDADERTDGDADKYKTKELRKRKDNPSLPSDVNASLNASLNASQTASLAQPMSASQAASLNASMSASRIAYGSPPSIWGQPVSGYDFVDGSGYRNTATGEFVRSLPEIQKLMKGEQ